MTGYIEEREGLLVALLEAYCSFFTKDNLLSLIDGRSFEDILGFLDALECIHDEEYPITELNTLIQELTEMVKCYVDSIEEVYGYKDISCLRLSGERLTKAQVVPFFIEAEFRILLFAFFDAYDFMTKYKQTDKVDAPLVEFNNFMSHMLRHCLEHGRGMNGDRASGHLYRSTVDIYKQFIVDHKNLVYSDNNLMTELMELRKVEMGLVGHSEMAEGKKGIIDSYKVIVDHILHVLSPLDEVR